MLLDFKLAGEPMGKTMVRYVDLFGPIVLYNVIQDVIDRSHGGRKMACVSKVGVADQ